MNVYRRRPTSGLVDIARWNSQAEVGRQQRNGLEMGSRYLASGFESSIILFERFVNISKYIRI